MKVRISKLGSQTQGILCLDGKGYHGFLGKGGLWGTKREGDGRSPRGIFQLEAGFYRSDKLIKPNSALPFHPITPDLGWCDDPTHNSYNTLVTLPFAGRHEKLWREDGLYDLVLVISHNRHPAIKGLGSAIFIHCLEERTTHTEGCFALKKQKLIKICSQLAYGDKVVFGSR